jgi:hypothetical protein
VNVAALIATRRIKKRGLRPKHNDIEQEPAPAVMKIGLSEE